MISKTEDILQAEIFRKRALENLHRKLAFLELEKSKAKSYEKSAIHRKIAAIKNRIKKISFGRV